MKKTLLQQRVEAGEVKTVLYGQYGNVGVYWAVPSRSKKLL